MENLLLFWFDLAWSCAGWIAFCLLLAGIGWYSFATRTKYPPMALPQKDSDNPDSWPKYRYAGR